MDKAEIANKAKAIKTKEDLLDLLNDIKAEELGSSAYPISIKQLNFYCNPNHEIRYINFEIPKKSGGVRKISSPVNGLKDILTYVNILFQSLYTPSQNVMGFVPGKSVVDNAMMHIHQNYVFNIDLKDFFSSIRQPRVWKRFQLKPFNFGIPVSNVLAGLCCIRLDNERGPIFVLPQGAPTSPIITNMICDTLDRRLKGLAKRFGLNYSRYADDITFSSMHNVYDENSEFRKELKRIISDQGFTINSKKTRLEKLGARQEVTGLIVSDKVNVLRTYVRSLRNLLYIWKRYGYTAAFLKFYPIYIQNKKGRIKGDVKMEEVIYGKLMYLKMVKGEKNVVYLRLKEQFDELMGYLKGAGTIGNENYSYLDTYTIQDFEKIIGCKISYETTNNGKEIATFIVNNHKYVAFLSKSSKVYKNISLCQKKDGTRFFLLHQTIHRSFLTEKKANVSYFLDCWEKAGIELAMEKAFGRKMVDNNIIIEPKTQNLKFFIEMLLLSPDMNFTNSQRLANLMHRDNIEIINKNIKFTTFQKDQDRLEKSQEPEIIHNPLAVKNVLEQFAKTGTALKYTTHDWEHTPGTNEYQWNTFSLFYNDYKSELNPGKGQKSPEGSHTLQEIFNCDKYHHLYYLIYKFLFKQTSAMKRNHDENMWGENQIRIGYGYPEKQGLADWMEENPGKQPASMPISYLPKEFQIHDRINGHSIVYFKDIIDVFKHEIEFRDDDLYWAIRQIFRSMDHHLNEDKLSTLTGLSIYTDVQRVKQALNVIAENIKSRPEHPEIEVSATLTQKDNQKLIVLSILHVNSFSDKPIDDDKLILRNNKGQMLSIKELLLSLCDFSVVGRFRKADSLKSFEIKYLYDKDFNKSPSIEEIKEPVRGFEYRLVFYI